MKKEHVRRQKYDQEINQENFKVQRPYNRNTVHVEDKIKSVTINNWGQLAPSQNLSENT